MDIQSYRGQLAGISTRVSVRRESAKIEKTIVITGYDRPAVKIQVRSDVNAAQRRWLAEWMAGR